jgi:hypothetical protein
VKGNVNVPASIPHYLIIKCIEKGITEGLDKMLPKNGGTFRPWLDDEAIEAAVKSKDIAVLNWILNEAIAHKGKTSDFDLLCSSVIARIVNAINISDKEFVKVKDWLEAKIKLRCYSLYILKKMLAAPSNYNHHLKCYNLRADVLDWLFAMADAGSKEEFLQLCLEKDKSGKNSLHRIAELGVLEVFKCMWDFLNENYRDKLTPEMVISVAEHAAAKGNADIAILVSISKRASETSKKSDREDQDRVAEKGKGRQKRKREKSTSANKFSEHEAEDDVSVRQSEKAEEQEVDGVVQQTKQAKGVGHSTPSHFAPYYLPYYFAPYYSTNLSSSSSSSQTAVIWPSFESFYHNSFGSIASAYTSSNIGQSTSALNNPYLPTLSQSNQNPVPTVSMDEIRAIAREEALRNLSKSQPEFFSLIR